MAVQEILKGLPAGLHVGDDPFPFSRANKQFSPLDDDNARPELRRSGHGQMMTLPDWKVPKPSPGLLGLAYVAETGSREVDAIERRAGRGRSRRVRLGQQRPDAVRKGVTLLPPRVKALLVPEEFLKRTAPGGAFRSE
jgi:hypothetical protein